MRKRFLRAWHRLKHYLRRHVPETLIAALLFAFFIVFFAKDMFYTIPAGYVGVLWERFGGGTVLNRTLGEGFQVIMPWNKIYLYDTRVQLRNERLDVLSIDGLNLVIDISYQFELVPANVPRLHDFVGPLYLEVMLDPDVAAQARDVFSTNTPQEIFSDRRKQIQAEILAAVSNHLHFAFSRDHEHPIEYLRIESVLVRSIKLPPSVEAAINSKNEQQQLNQEYDYRILREAKESERKRIEALGIRDFQDTVSRGITEGYLRWRGIEATLELAKSNNAKVVVIGGGKSGLPIILGDGSGAPATTASANAADTQTATDTLSAEAAARPVLTPLAELQKQLGPPHRAPTSDSVAPGPPLAGSRL